MSDACLGLWSLPGLPRVGGPLELCAMGFTGATRAWGSDRPEWTHALCMSLPFLHVLHCPTAIHLQNTTSEIELLQKFKTSESKVLNHARGPSLCVCGRRRGGVAV